MISKRHFWITLLLMVGLGLCLSLRADEINPYPRQIIHRQLLTEWNFEQSVQGWQPTHDCSVHAETGNLRIQSTGVDPYSLSPVLSLQGPVIVKLQFKTNIKGPGEIFYITESDPAWSQNKSIRFSPTSDNNWHDYEITIPVETVLKQIRLDPGPGPGTAEVAKIEIIGITLHPLEIEKVSVNQQGTEIQVWVRNHGKNSIKYTVGDTKAQIGPKESLATTINPKEKKALEAYPLVVEGENLPPLTRTVFIYRPSGQAEWTTLSSDKLVLRIAQDGSVGQLQKDNKLVAVLAPLVHCAGKIPLLKMAPPQQDNKIIFQGEGIEVILELAGSELKVQIASEQECEGPVVRALGALEQGLFSGLEYLGQGEKSSSKLDIESEGYLRFAPDLDKVTMPLMAFITSDAKTPSQEVGDTSMGKWRAVALLWNDMALQPVYATPNFFDGSDDHRLSLKGKKIEATILVDDKRLDDVILWALAKRTLPEPPKPPRSWQQQKELCLVALNGPVKGEGGWRHCVGDRWPVRPYADHASTIWHLTGQVVELQNVVPGGSHIPNNAFYFVSHRAQEWLGLQKKQVESILSTQQQDGSFRYKGKYQQGHFEDTASGYCAQRAKMLLEIAWLTGDSAALAGGLKTLEYMKRFRTPRGAQTWELSLHTPDILASAYLVWAYVRGYQLTNNPDYLAQARRWALTGVPFVYQWGRYPVMLYATTAVYGATNWQAPDWIGLPVQWCGSVYAYAILMLAEHDQTLNWRQLAEGILIAAEQMQYTEGNAGTLPDSFYLKKQERRGPDINPCALVSLHMCLRGEVDSLAVATSGTHRVTAPFGIKIIDAKAQIQVPQGFSYQVLVDGGKIIDITSKGLDVIPLD